MRKIYFLALSFVCSSSLFAQLEKNKFYPGLSVTGGFRSSPTAWELRPSGSFALGKHSMLTVFGTIQKGREMTSPYFTGASGIMSGYGAGISYAYYRYFKKGGRLGWYLEASFSFNHIELQDYYEFGSMQSVNTRSEKQLFITPGLFYTVSPRVMLFANFGSMRVVGDYGPNTFGRSINIGVKIALGKIPKRK